MQDFSGLTKKPLNWCWSQSLAQQGTCTW